MRSEFLNLGFLSEIEKPVMELVEQEEQEIVEEVVELAPEPEPETVAPHFVELLKDQVCLVECFCRFIGLIL